MLNTAGRLMAAALAVCILASAAQAVVVIQDFGNAAIASYTTYGGNKAPAGTANLAGWEVGGRYFKFEDVGSGRVMSATQDFSGYDLGITLTAQSYEYRPAWDAAQASEALSLANADDLNFDVVYRIPVAGQPTTSFKVTMYYYDTSAAAATSMQILAPAASSWTLNQTKTFTVDVDALANFDKAADKVYGFRMSGVWGHIGTTFGSYGLSTISYTEVPEPTTIALLGGALVAGAVRRRRA